MPMIVAWLIQFCTRVLTNKSKEVINRSQYILPEEYFCVEVFLSRSIVLLLVTRTMSILILKDHLILDQYRSILNDF